MGDYKIRGSGNVHTVWDGDRLVGRVHRREGTETTASINFTKGSASFRKRRAVWWVATLGEGDERVRNSDGRDKCVACGFFFEGDGKCPSCGN